MSSRHIRMWLVPLLLLAGKAGALGLGEIRLSSALNEPLDAQIELLSATPDELENLRIQLASAETFSRYDLDRPLFLTRIDFRIVRSGRAGGNYIRVTSAEPVTEPFITILVEASWSRGRLLREYTLLLDPPTFAPPPTTQATQPVTAPTRQAPADSGAIERPAPQPQATPRQAVQAPQQSTPRPAREVPATESTPGEPPAPRQEPDTFGQPEFDTAPGGDIVVQRGNTLWGITQRVRPDSRLTINQTMLAIFRANPDAFDGNINLMRAGATLTIPSADDIFRISRSEALTEVSRQNSAWSGAPLPAPRPGRPPAPVDTGPSLTLVPPDDENSAPLPDSGPAPGVEDLGQEPDTSALTDPVEERIREIQSILEDQDALIEIPDNELAALRAELAELRGEPPPPPVDAGVENPLEDQVFVDEEPDTAATDEGGADETTEPAPAPAPAIVTRPPQQESLLDRVLGVVNQYWWIVIGGALVLALLILVWFMRRAGRDEDDVTGVWDTLDADEIEAEGSAAATSRLSALAQEDESIVVVETRRAPDDYAVDDEIGGDTVLRPQFRAAPEPVEEDVDPLAATGTNRTLEDTFSSETAINLDQSDPIAEADFHMAYGLYDQAADLINGALEADPDRDDLLSKLCEIYFVWGNRDGFVDAAIRRKALVSADGDPEWDKIVIMGQQIAGEHELFSGVRAAGATRAVDLSFEGGADDAAALDIDFAGEPDGDSIDFVDLGAAPDRNIGDETGQVSIAPDTGTGIDFDLDDSDDVDLSVTREMPEPTVESPTIENRLSLESTREMAANDGGAEVVDLRSADATAEIDLDDLGLDLDGLDDVVDSGDDEGNLDDIVDLGALDELVDGNDSEVLDIGAGGDEETGRNKALDDPFALATTGTREMPTTRSSLDETGTAETLADFDSLAETGTSEVLSADFDVDEDTGTAEAFGDFDSLDDTGTSEMLADVDDDIDESLRDTGRNVEIPIVDDEATGTRQILGIEEALAAQTAEVPAVDIGSETGLMEALGDDEATRLASLDDDDADATGLMPAMRDRDRTGLAPMDEDTDVGLDSSLLDATGQTQVLSGDLRVDSTGRRRIISDNDATLLAPDDDDEGTVALPGDAATMMAPLDDDEDDFDFAKTEALPKDVFSADMSSDETGALPELPGGTDLDLDLDDLTAALKVSEIGDTVNQMRDDATVQQPRIRADRRDDTGETGVTQSLAPEDLSADLHDARTMTEVGTKLDLARAYVDMGDPEGARSILEEVLDEGDEGQRQQAQRLLDSLPA